MNDKVADEDLKNLVSSGYGLFSRVGAELLSLRHPAPCVCGKWVADTPFCPYCGHPIEAKAKGDAPVVKYWRGLSDETLLRKMVNGFIVECIDHGNVREPSTSEKYLYNKANEEITAAEYEAAKTPEKMEAHSPSCDWHNDRKCNCGYEVAKTSAPIFVAGAGAARLVGADIEPAVAEPWINVPDYPGSSNRIQRAIEQLQRRVAELEAK